MSSNNIKKNQGSYEPKHGKNRVILSNNNKSNLFKSSSITYMLFPNNNNNNNNDINNSKTELKESNSLPKISFSNINIKNNINETVNQLYLNDELSIIKNMWKDLGVTDKYKIEFLNYLRNSNDKEKSQIFQFEKKYLKKFRDSLLNFSKEVSNRENNIQNLKQLNISLKNFIHENEENKIESLLSKIVQLINEIRINSINIVNYMVKIRETSSYYSNREKYNLNNINKAYLYDNDFLINMGKDINFLNNSNIFKYLDIKNNTFDTFFTNCIPEDDNKNNDKIKIPINNNLLKAIQNSKYIILQDKFFNRIKNNNIDFYNKIHNKDFKNFKKISISKPKFSGFDDSRIKSAKYNSSTFYNEKILNNGNNISNILYKLRKEKGIKGYNELFLKPKMLNLFDEQNNKKILYKKKHKKSKSEKKYKIEHSFNIINDENSNEKNNNKIELLYDNEKEYINKTEFSDFKVEFYTKSINDLINILKKKNYFNNIPEILKKNLNINKNFLTEEILLNGYYPKIIICYQNKKNENDIYGLCKFSFDNTFNNNKKIIIEHISCNIPNYKIIENIINYIKQNISFNEISIELKYSNNENRFEIDKEINNLFENQLQFKWANIYNIKNNKERIKTIHFINDNKKDFEEEFSISIDSISILSLNNIQTKNLIYNQKYINIFSIYALLSEKNKNKDIKLNKLNDNGIIFEFSKKNYIKNIYKFKLNIQNKKQIENFLKNSKRNFELDICLYNNEKPCDLISIILNLKLKSTITLKYNDYLYNRIEEKINVFKMDNSKFYIIPTNDINNRIIIGELTKELKDKLINNHKNIYEIFNSLNFNMIEESNDNLKKEIIYIPSFNIDSHLMTDYLDSIEKNISILNQDNKLLYIDSIDEIFKIKWNFDLDFKNNYSFIPNENNGEIIINNSFIFGICNLNVLSIFKIPVIQLYIVTKENWKKI